MFLAAAAIIGGVGALGSIAGSSTQAAGQQQAAQTQWNMFNTINQQQQPFIQGGYSALNSLLYGLGVPSSAGGGTTQPTGSPPSIAPTARRAMLPGGQMIPGLTTGAPGGAATGAGASGGGVGFGQFTDPFTVSDFVSNLNPGYGFQLKTGEQAVRNADTPSQGALSGATLKDLMGFGEGLANTSYNNAFSNWMTQNNAIFGRLSGIAGLGQNAAANVGASGTTLGTGVAQSQAAAAGSLGAGIIGAGNSVGTGLQSAALLNYLNGSGGSGIGGGAGGGPG